MGFYGADKSYGGDGNDSFSDHENYNDPVGYTDYMYGGAGNDSLDARDRPDAPGASAPDYLYGGTHTTGDWCSGEANDVFRECENSTRY